MSRREPVISLEDPTSKNIAQLNFIEYPNGIAYYNDQCVGAVASRFEADEKEPTREKCYIMSIGVLPAYRQLKIGSKMLQHVLAIAEKNSLVTDCYLHVQTNNDVALDFYKSFGFVVERKIEGYYKRIDPPDCFLVSKKIHS